MKPIFIVAEIGINHNGDMSICKKLIDTAKEAGCDAVKFQKRDLDQVYTQEFLDSPRESQWGTTQRDQKKGLEFGINQYKEIDAYCKEKKVEWYASAWDLNSQEFLRQFNCNYNKVASAMIIYEDLLKKIAEEGKHTFISTGMSEYNNIQKAVDIFRSAKCPFELMHTVSTYPMKDEDANLKLINTLRDKFDCDVGYSGHEVGLAISYAATTLNITSLERHITLSRAMYGSDQAASLELLGMKNLSESINKIILSLGEPSLGKIIDDELPIAKKLRAHIKY